MCRTCLALFPTHSLCWGLSWLEGMRGQPWSLPVHGCVPEPRGFQLPGPAGATSALLPVGTLGAVPGGSPCPVKGPGAALLLPTRRWAAWPRSWQSPAQQGGVRQVCFVCQEEEEEEEDNISETLSG